MTGFSNLLSSYNYFTLAGKAERYMPGPIIQRWQSEEQGPGWEWGTATDLLGHKCMAHRWGRRKIAELPERQSLGAKHMKTTLSLPAPTLQWARLKLYPINGKAEEPAPGCSQHLGSMGQSSQHHCWKGVALGCFHHPLAGNIKSVSFPFGGFSSPLLCAVVTGNKSGRQWPPLTLRA